MIISLSKEDFIEKSIEVREKPTSTINVLADLTLKLNVEQPDYTIQAYFGPSPDSMTWVDYQDFMKKVGVL
jgi:hypothetical protein